MATGIPGLGRRQVLVVFSGLMLSMMLAALDSTIVATALPTIVGELGGLERLAWVVTAYLLAQTVATPLYGKLGDLYGRKRILQGAIVLFLTGSALCGLSRSMTQLIVFRAIQGLGGGGLIVTTQAVVADIIPARERGRYMGIFGAVFGVASIAGPLLGGYFTTHLTWRWIFYINLPLGVIALLVLAVTLPRTLRRTDHAVDYAGALLLAVLLSGVILYTDFGGTVYSWTSPVMFTLAGVSALALALFIAVERRAREPVLPLGLFRNRTFTTTVAVGTITGFAMFGSVTYMPVYLQVVSGASPTASGLQMVPMMGGMLLSSIVSGQLISHTGKYRIFPIVGTIVMCAGLFLLSRLAVDTTRMEASLSMLVLGLGMGMVMQVLVLAVQNAVEHRDIGVATSGATLFRLIGGSVGTAVMGAIFAQQLAANLARRFPGGLADRRVTLQTLGALSPAERTAYLAAFTGAIDTIFLIGLGVGVIGVVFAVLVPERPLRTAVASRAAHVGDEISEAFAIPISEEAERKSR